MTSERRTARALFFRGNKVLILNAEATEHRAPETVAGCALCMRKARARVAGPSLARTDDAQRPGKTLRALPCQVPKANA